MKRLVFLFLLSVLALASFAQFADTSQLNSFIRDTIRDRRPERVTAEQMQRALFGISNFAGKAIFNDTAKQSGKTAWVDTLKAGYYLTAVDSFRRDPFRVTPNGPGSILFVTDNFPGGINLNNSWNDYGFPGPLIDFTSLGDSAKFRRSPVLNVYKKFNDSGMSVWGENDYYLQSALASTNYFMPKMRPGTITNYNLRSEFDHGFNSIQSNLNFGWTSENANDTLGLSTGDSPLNGPVNILMRNDLYKDGNVRYKHTGFLTSCGVGWDLPPGNGSTYGSFVDYYAGYVRGSAASVDAKYLYYGEDIGFSWVNRPWGLFIKGTGNAKNYLQAPLLIGDSSIINADINKFYVLGSSKFAGNIVQSTGRTILAGAVDDGSTSLQVDTACIFAIKREGPGFGVNYFNVNNFGRGLPYMEFKIGKGGPYQAEIDFVAGAQNEAVIERRDSGRLKLQTYFGGDIVLYTRGSTNKVQLSTNLTEMTGKALINGASSDGVNAAIVNGTVKATAFISTSTVEPASSSDATGQVGEIRIVSGYLYAKDASGWKRVALSTF